MMLCGAFQPAMKPIKKLNLNRRKLELALSATVDRLNSLGGSMTATLNRAKPKAMFSTSYKLLLTQVDEQVEMLRSTLMEIEDLLAATLKEEKKQAMADEVTETVTEAVKKWKNNSWKDVS